MPVLRGTLAQRNRGRLHPKPGSAQQQTIPRSRRLARRTGAARVCRLTRRYGLAVAGTRGHHVCSDGAMHKMRQGATAMTKRDECREVVAVIGFPLSSPPSLTVLGLGARPNSANLGFSSSGLQAVARRRHQPAVSGRTGRGTTLRMPRGPFWRALPAQGFSALSARVRAVDVRGACLASTRSSRSSGNMHSDRSLAEFPGCRMWQRVRSARDGIGNALAARSG